MKVFQKIQILPLLIVCLLSTTVIAQEETGLPGDNFSLEGALSIFKESKSLEDFEKKLNSEDNNVNNLDLNDDGDIDYVRVIDNKDGDVHAIVLQVPVSKLESQDIAVIEIEKTGNESALLQIVGDEDVYGESTIVEPFEEESRGGKGGPDAQMETMRIVVNVWFWPSVRWIYGPRYRVYVSPWYWGYYPNWWRPWRPRPWRTFYAGGVRYRTGFHVVTTHRVVRAHRVYTPRRTTSAVVVTRTRTAKKTRVATTKATAGKTTTTKVGVKKQNGKVAVGKTTTTKTGVKGKNGRAAGKTTTTTKGAVVGKNGRAAAGKKTTTTKSVRGKNGNRGTVKKSTTRGAARGKNGAVRGKKTTTVKRARKN